VIPLGKWNFRELVEAGRRDEVLRYLLQLCQRTENIFKDIFDDSNEDSSVVNQYTAILDFDGFSFHQLTCAKSKMVLLDS
jgi:hypothetical protein